MRLSAPGEKTVQWVGDGQRRYPACLPQSTSLSGIIASEQVTTVFSGHYPCQYKLIHWGDQAYDLKIEATHDLDTYYTIFEESFAGGSVTITSTSYLAKEFRITFTPSQSQSYWLQMLPEVRY